MFITIQYDSPGSSDKETAAYSVLTVDPLATHHTIMDRLVDDTPGRVRPQAPRNRTIRLSVAEEARCAALARDPSTMTPAPDGRLRSQDIVDAVFLGDSSEIGPLLPLASVDLLLADPPYDLPKNFDGERFAPMGHEAYLEYTRGWLGAVAGALKPNASIYVCSDWKSSSAVYLALAERFTVRNCITWKRDKGRSSASNWKNASEDVWFATVSDEYTFYPDAVRVRKRVIAPYRKDGEPKDWTEDQSGRWRLTGASNLWDDLTVPFWSMPENTDHPTQKPEKLAARILLASSVPGDLVLDPFLGSGTTAVAAKKLGRHFTGIERSSAYCALAIRRLELAKADARIQGFDGESFTARNQPVKRPDEPTLFTT